MRATGRFACTGAQRSQVEEEELERESLLQESINSVTHSQDLDFGNIDSVLLNYQNHLELPIGDLSPAPLSSSSQTQVIELQASIQKHAYDESPSFASNKHLRNNHSYLSLLSTSLAEANQEAIYQRTHGILSKQECVVHIIQQDYGNRYSTEHMVKAVCLFQD